jgi:putative transposase
MINNQHKITKTELAKRLGISRQLLYYKHKRPAIDEEVRCQIEAVLSNHPAYGHKRVALELKLNKKRIRRVMKKFNLKPYRKRKSPRKTKDKDKKPTKYKNLIINTCPIHTNIIWVSDFTYIKFKEKFIYLATIMDVYTREIIGWNISRFHNAQLVLGALEDALSKYPKPIYLHSDQGSEYDSQEYTNTAEKIGIKISMSRKQSPWENAYQESFYSNFKLDLGDPARFEPLGKLIEAIHQTIKYYNTKRIHTALKMSPEEYRLAYSKNTRLCTSLSSKLGT